MEMLKLLGIWVGDKGPITRRTGDITWVYPHFIWEGKDGEEVAKKAWVLAKNVGVIASVPAIVDITCMPRPETGVPMVLQRLKYWGVPTMGGAVAYVCTMHVLATMRKGRDDRINHFWAGVAWGLVIGKHFKSVTAGGISALGLGITGWFTKEIALNGHKGFNGSDLLLPRLPTKEKQLGGPFAHHHDYTFVPQRPRYWVRSPEEIPEVQKNGPYGVSQWDGTRYYPRSSMS